MSLIFLCLVVLTLCAAGADTQNYTKNEYLDLADAEDNVMVWKSLFTKINAILYETTQQSENLVRLNNRFDDLSKRFDDLSKRQDAHEQLLVNFIDSPQKHLTDLKKGLDTQELKLNNFMEQYRNDIQKHLTDLKKGQDTQEFRWTNFMEQYSNDHLEWTTILRRQDGSVDFYRNWTEYQNGFGNTDGEFFIGLERLHAMTTLGDPQQLIVILKDFENHKRIAKYDIFQIGNETEKYPLKQLGKYSGDAGDSFSSHIGMKFSTYDQDNDVYAPSNCAEFWKGAWWFKSCYDSHLFATHRRETVGNNRGIGWHSWKDSRYPLKYAEMRIRSKNV